jgi:putative solute:sodium symporter small subunit
MQSLLRTQLRLGLTVLALVIGPLAALPALFVVSPELRAVNVLGLPLAWLLLAIAVYPVLVIAGWWYARRAEQAEAEFVELVERT